MRGISKFLVTFAGKKYVEMKRRLVFLCCIMAWGLSLQAKGEGGGPWGFVKKVGTFLDSLSVSGVDRSYIEAPKHPWQILLRGNVNQSDLKLTSKTSHAEETFDFLKGDMTWEPRIKTRPATYLGLWAGYRGYGLGYSWNVGGDKGRILTFGVTGGRYGVNLRIHWFDTDEPQVGFTGTGLMAIADDGSPIYSSFNYNDKIDMNSPIKMRALFLDGYYLFNGKKCSYAAAYDQSVVQRRSAGSLMAGAMYFHSTTHYDDNINADLIMFMNDIGRIKAWQASAGVGYIYNWVPARGLLISAMGIPMLTFYNHYKTWRYDSNLKDLIMKEGTSKIKEMEEEDYVIRPARKDAVKSGSSSFKVNFDARLSVTYEWNDRVFMNVFGQFSTFRYSIENVRTRLNEWYINAAIGVRL